MIKSRFPSRIVADTGNLLDAVKASESSGSDVYPLIIAFSSLQKNFMTYLYESVMKSDEVPIGVWEYFLGVSEFERALKILTLELKENDDGALYSSSKVLSEFAEGLSTTRSQLENCARVIKELNKSN